MFQSFFKKLSGRQYRKFIKKSRPVVERINEIEREYQGLSDEQLRAKTDEFKARLEGGETLDDLLPEAFAAVKNTARRLYGKEITVVGQTMVWEMIHYDVQLIGGVALHNNMIAEMATGEGKTLVATLPLYLNALTGRNCQLVTVNEYFAQRDSEWMGYIYNFLGVTVGCIKGSHQQSPAEKREQYNRDITYGTASEYGFDYLRDNGMAIRASDQVQRDHYFCIVDEVDSVLIDEARTPLIISGPAQNEREAPYHELKGQVERLVRRQHELCNRLAVEAKAELEKEDGDVQLGCEKLLQVKLGMPKNKQLLRMLEGGDIRKEFERFDLEMAGDFNKARRFRLKEELYYIIEEKQHSADLTEHGRNLLRPDDADAFVLPDLPTQYMEIDKDPELDQKAKDKAKAEAQQAFERTSEEIHTISQLLRAYSLYERDKEYVVQDGKVMIVDENTGRVMPGRRWGEGLHQAIEAKENVKIEKESKTYATITIQNHFRLYDKLAGMTGTAETEANEFKDIYSLDVMVIPTHKPCIRRDENDLIYKTRREKYNAVVDEIRRSHGRGQPVLVGTVSVEASEVLSRMLRRANIPHSVLNAKHHQQEAEIVARAGQRGVVTIATNMAGRGTDIKLGEGVPEVGGLYVLGTERHTARRIDRQLRGRCARQGDPGYSRFYLSLEDDLMRLYGSGFAGKMLESSFEEGHPLEHKWLNPAIERAQKTVEQHHYSTRKRLLQFDDVLNQQREVIYGIRNEAIATDDPRAMIFEFIEEELDEQIAESGIGAPSQTGEDDGSASERLEGLVKWTNTQFPVGLTIEEIEGLDAEGAKAKLLERIRGAYDTKEAVEEPEALKNLERYVIIQTIDRNWQDHLTEMEDLRQSVGLRGYGQRDPLNEYKSEAFRYFEQLMTSVRSGICSGIFRTASNVRSFESMLGKLSRSARMIGPSQGEEPAAVGNRSGTVSGGAAAAAGGGAREVTLPNVGAGPVVREEPRIGRNELVTIRRGGETRQLKYKKARDLIDKEGWELVLEK